jgi:hypothetical protein
VWHRSVQHVLVTFPCAVYGFSKHLFDFLGKGVELVFPSTVLLSLSACIDVSPVLDTPLQVWSTGGALKSKIVM